MRSGDNPNLTHKSTAATALPFAPLTITTKPKDRTDVTGGGVGDPGACAVTRLRKPCRGGGGGGGGGGGTETETRSQSERSAARGAARAFCK
ncbi:hypothetical protein chiPu_0011920 [Chiloscyllium punctatum]|uniref:Uncharacterized protein n=1 Tax=Chiloscyllium punctatum TaxID=137246 RepID=A0A401SST6_CHIPU|nr:hypothetical protein [Chiloscyllium punctatum]